ncbi:MAG: efflux RND transporter periplasmic adaptor subunit [bacterium]
MTMQQRPGSSSISPPSRRRAWLGIVLLGLVVALPGCGSKKRKKRARRQLPVVHVQTVQPSSRSTDIIASGVSAPLHDIALATQVAGVITRFNVYLGRRVKKNELLVRVSTVGLFGQAQAARAQIQQFRTDIRKADRDVLDAKRLYEARVESRKAYEDAKFQLQRLRAQLAQARATLGQIGESYAGGVVHAPFAGVIAQRLVDIGDYVSPGKVIGRLVDLHKVLITAGVSEQDVLHISAQTPLEVTFAATGKRRFAGRIRAIAPTSDPNTGAYPVEIVVDNPQGLIKGGMTARVVFKRPAEQGLFLPVEAVLRRDGQSVVYVLRSDGRHVDRRVVKLDDARDGQVRILSGLPLGQRVVVSGNSRLQHGSQVLVAGQGGASSTSGTPEKRAGVARSQP